MLGHGRKRIQTAEIRNLAWRATTRACPSSRGAIADFGAGGPRITFSCGSSLFVRFRTGAASETGRCEITSARPHVLWPSLQVSGELARREDAPRVVKLELRSQQRGGARRQPWQLDQRSCWPARGSASGCEEPSGMEFSTFFFPIPRAHRNGSRLIGQLQSF